MYKRQVKNDEPHYGVKEHTSVDTKNGFVLATKMTPASVHDSKYLPYLTLASCHTEEPIKKVYGETFAQPAEKCYLSCLSQEN